MTGKRRLTQEQVEIIATELLAVEHMIDRMLAPEVDGTWSHISERADQPTLLQLSEISTLLGSRRPASKA